MKDMKSDADDIRSPAEPGPRVRKPYEPPKVEKRRSLVRVTLLTGTGQMGVGLVSTMN